METERIEPEAFPKFIHVSEQPDGQRVFDLWRPEPTGHYETDFALGVHYADLTIEIARLQGSSDFIVNVLAALVSKQTISYLEGGFIRAISQRAYAGSRN
jgi:hypothetical protein